MRYFKTTLRTALKALHRNVMRSALTTLGIVIGVAAVIAMMEISQGSARSIQQTVQNMGANTIWVQPSSMMSGGVNLGNDSTVTLTADDADCIARECPAVVAVAPILRTRTQVVYGNRNWKPIYIYGTTPAYLDVRNRLVEDGENFTDRDVHYGAKVCLLGQTVVRELFVGEDPIGKEIRINNVPLRVTGVLARKGMSMFGYDDDDCIVAPWTTIKYRVAGMNATISSQPVASTDPTQKVNTLNQLYPVTQAVLYPERSPAQLANTPQPVRFDNIERIMLKVATPEDIPETMKRIAEVLRAQHRLSPGQPDDFTIRDMTEASRALGSTSETMAYWLPTVACISLLVGGVGIMNIMLVSVTERTREIGLRMAVGARARDILLQFLVESVLLCVFGGLVGIAAGCGVSWLASYFLRWPTETSLPAIFASVLVSATVGVVFGYYPAWKASRLDPIEALRYE
jgi:ABC-type antimicrobial peptide transport system permease subunit